MEIFKEKFYEFVVPKLGGFKPEFY